ncbi:group III truncated hemoglobin [Pelagibacterium flavum]|uniref:Group III truncated hemoglobin n=1 Tax=Pelagibacterium flavum TaxID=2984530 RepID=A0ABY6ITB2_9HYPH|nr:group III truncated hemoglobin [Pelagibacterium sp. YIM 151497]UYQ72654.1 group III truncated hemoglobin [Pelagibacterium sp. YIM 151497]
MTELSEDGLRLQVTRFYEKVRADGELAPIFADTVEDWDDHINRLTDFWSSVMLTSGRYKGNPFGAHLSFASRLTPALFSRWLALWSQTAREIFDPVVANALEGKASRIAQSLRAGLFGFKHTPADSVEGVHATHPNIVSGSHHDT